MYPGPQRALRLTDDRNELKVRALPNGELLFELAKGDGSDFLLFLLNAERETLLRALLEERERTRST